MRGAPYTTCTLRALWWRGPAPQDGAFLVTPAGSAYRIEEVRPGRTARFVLRCTRWPRDEVPDDALVYEFTWARR